MAQVWQPQEAGLVQLCHLLSEVQKPGANQAQVRLVAQTFTCFVAVHKQQCYSLAVAAAGLAAVCLLTHGCIADGASDSTAAGGVQKRGRFQQLPVIHLCKGGSAACRGVFRA